MINKKICMLGAFSVGKTSLVEKFVHSIFTDKYLSTVGVKISKKNVNIDNKEINLILWDMEGQDIYSNINLAFLRGSMGYFIVLDGLRQETYHFALEVYKLTQKKTKDIPCYFLINKADLQTEWEITPDMITSLEDKGIQVLITSAKTGVGVENAFIKLSKDMCRG